MSSLQFNAVLLEISKQLSADQLDSLKFLCRTIIGKREAEKISSGIKLFEVLTERGQLTVDNTKYLSDLLKEIRRQDLSEKLDNFECESLDAQPEEAERGMNSQSCRCSGKPTGHCC